MLTALNGQKYRSLAMSLLTCPRKDVNMLQFVYWDGITVNFLSVFLLRTTDRKANMEFALSPES